MVLDPEFDELRREFLAEADEKVREMQSALEQGQSNETLERLKHIAHQLKGSGGSYGYQSISADAAEIERAIEEVNGDSEVITPMIQQHVVNLRDEILRATREFH